MSLRLGIILVVGYLFYKCAKCLLNQVVCVKVGKGRRAVFPHYGVEGLDEFGPFGGFGVAHDGGDKQGGCLAIVGHGVEKSGVT